MAGAKTLKVSYGSFSCTLEGFDDPVATLRSITEHFQSLSAPERLFEAEGSVPDADLLMPVQGGGDTAPTLPPQDAPPRPRPAAADRDTDISRLLSQTIGQMEGADQRRRLATIGHLKAAVAATADDPAAGLGGDPARAARYRADLASVVRSSRPPDPRSAPGGRLPPVPNRQMPLLLVPELRVALPPVPPDAEPATDTQPPAFADFADRIAAGTLPDLMEAAAAFVICMEGATGFTRPDLMRLLTALPGPRGGSPEDQMRGFGRLLREGRFLRAGRGTFALPGDAPVLARARRLLA